MRRLRARFSAASSEVSEASNFQPIQTSAAIGISAWRVPGPCQSRAKGARTERAGRTAPLPSSATLATGIATVPKSVGVSSANGADSPDKLADL